MLLRKLAVALVLSSLAILGAKADDKVLKVGSTPTGIPFTFLDTKTNTIEGVMVDLIKEIGKDAGFKVEIEGMQFSTLIPSLTSNKIDIICCRDVHHRPAQGGDRLLRPSLHLRRRLDRAEVGQQGLQGVR